MEDISKFKCPYVPKEQIWQAAEDFRSEYWPEATLPVDIERIIEERLKLNIEPEQGLLSQIDIDAYLRIDFTGIVVDYDCYMNEKFMNRLRFSFAHELGHHKSRARLLAEVETCLRKVQGAGMLHLVRTDPDAILSSMTPTLCRPFGVSYQVIERRVEREELWPPKIEYVDGIGVKKDNNFGEQP